MSHHRSAGWNKWGVFGVLWVIQIASGIALEAQTIAPDERHVRIVPQQAWLVHRGQPAIEVVRVQAEVLIVDQVATTVVDIEIRNRTGSRQEAEMLIPVPDDSVLRGFEFAGSAKEPTARLLPKDEAKRLYESIVARTRDPALLEFLGGNAIRSSVFPVEPNQTQRVRVTYEQILIADGNRVDYVLPRTESLDYRTPWTVRVRVRAAQGVATVYSPSHELDLHGGAGHYPASGSRTVEFRVSERSLHQPGSFRLSYLLIKGDVTASLLAYPDARMGGGYFLLLAGLPPSAAAPGARIQREVTLVLDRSGSMSGKKLDQAKAAALQIVEGLDHGESFNIITYNESVESFSTQAVRKNDSSLAAARRYIQSILPRGGTNIYDSLSEGLRQRPIDGTLPIVLFLTDGLPTIGRVSEKEIRELAQSGNPYHKRVFTFGVGVDVNSPLLENIAYQSRGVATFALPDEDLELKVAGVFARLDGPLLASPNVRIVDAAGHPSPGRVHDLLPVRIPDLYQNDQLVLLGRYVGDEPLRMELTGETRGTRRKFHFQFDLDRATTRNAFVPRLWAGRKIGVLNDAIRSMGADPKLAAGDPRVRELVDEIIQISTEFGVLSEYTAFLAQEGTNLSRPSELLSTAERNFYGRAIEVRSGAAAINQDFNSIRQKSAACLNGRNAYWNDKLELAEVSNVQQVADKAFYRRGRSWVDGELARENGETKPDRVIEFGSPAFFELAERLVREGRQGSFALAGDILLRIDGQSVLIRAAQQP